MAATFVSALLVRLAALGGLTGWKGKVGEKRQIESHEWQERERFGIF
jgi:hypothetical protein